MAKPSRKAAKTRKYVEVRCKGKFRFGRRSWSSNMVYVGVTVDITSDTAVVVKRYGQRPMGADFYIPPTVSQKELTRVKALALEMAKTAPAHREPSLIAFERIDAPKDPHKVHLCQRCTDRGVPCGLAVEMFEESWIRINNTAMWRKRCKPINRMRSLVHEAKTSGATTIDSVHRRLREKDKVMVLYHQTSEESAAKILRSQHMRTGKKGMLGAAIYFATSAAETDPKARQHGVVLKCLVYTGKTHQVLGPCPDMSFNELVDGKGCDSVIAKFPSSGDEIAVYASDQVLMIERA